MSSQLNCSGESLELDLEISITSLSIESVALAKTEAYHVINLVVVVDELITEDCFNHDIVIACVIYIHEDPNSTSSTPSFWESFFAKRDDLTFLPGRDSLSTLPSSGWSIFFIFLIRHYTENEISRSASLWGSNNCDVGLI